MKNKKLVKYMLNGQRYAIDCRNIKWKISLIYIGSGKKRFLSKRFECLSELNEEFYANSFPDAYDKIKNEYFQSLKQPK